MSISIIEDLYYCQHGNFETIPMTEEYQKTFKQLVEKENMLAKSLTKEQDDILNELCYLYGRLESSHGLSCYIEGFKIGLRVGIECMEEEKSE